LSCTRESASDDLGHFSPASIRGSANANSQPRPAESLRPSMRKTLEIGRSAAWNHAGKMVEYVCLYLVSLLIARGLGVEANGVFASLVSFSQLLLVLSSFGLETAVNTIFPRLAQGDAAGGRGKILGRLLALRAGLFVGISVPFLLAATWFSLWLAGPISSYALVLLAYTATRSLVSLLAAALTADLRTDVTARINVTARIIELAFLWWISAHGMTVVSVLQLFVVTGTLQLGAYLIVCRRLLPTTQAAETIRPIVAFGVIYWMNIAVDYILGRQGDIFLLSRLLADQTGASLYDVSYSITQLAQMGATAGLGGVTLAVFATLAVTSPGKVSDGYRILVRLVSLLTIPLFAFLAFNAVAVVDFLYSPAYAPAAGIVQGMVFFRIGGRLFGGGENADVLLSHGSVSSLVRIGVIAAFLNFSLDLLLIPRMGARGAMIASGIGNCTANLLGYIRVRRVCKPALQVGYWGRVVCICLLISFLVSLIVASSAGFTAVIRLGVFLVATVACARLLVTPEDRTRFRAIMVRPVRPEVRA
jgi:O-antigen/teichoic acid export membrane protein